MDNIKKSDQSSDLKFFTNTDNDSLYQRFYSILKNVEHFDVLVAYFYTSGFFRLHQELEHTKQIRILIGLNPSRGVVTIVDQATRAVQNEAHDTCRKEYSNTLSDELAYSEDSSEVETAAQKMIAFIKNKKLVIKVHPSRNIHAKVYITRFPKRHYDFGRVITGSSNFSENGLSAQREFNVELKDRVDVEYALNQFEELWEESVDVSTDYVTTIQTKTWLSDEVTPYQIYLKCLYEYFEDDIDIDEKAGGFTLPKPFDDFAYQREAVILAERILNKYNGVFISDVVGLGKTVMASLLLQNLKSRRTLVICPPALIKYWEGTLNTFGVHNCDVRSRGNLKNIQAEITESYSHVVVDESHQFRNELNQSYEALHYICHSKKVILISATPLNNRFKDIKAQIQLFQPIKECTIPGKENLDGFFKGLDKRVKNSENNPDKRKQLIKETSERVRDEVLKYIMVRRTRSEIVKYYSDDITKQGLKFPEVADPEKITYEFDAKIESLFQETIKFIKNLTYARYKPLTYLSKRKISELEKQVKQGQINLAGFIRVILIKRLESSFYAFKNSLRRFIESHEEFIKMMDGGTLLIGKDIDTDSLLTGDNEEELLELIEKDKVKKYPATDFRPQYRVDLQVDLDAFKKIQKKWERIKDDPKIAALTTALKNNKILAGRKMIIFSESKETVDYLYGELEPHFKDQVLGFSSSGGKFKNASHKIDKLRQFIQESYDPNHPSSNDNVKLLLTTDVLAEGVNLHRSNMIINYDLPWNPTRVLQRVGRVNRVGTKHAKIHVFNIFPTTQSDKHLGLEDNIKRKIQMFHDVLGEDAKYLTDDEEVSAHGLFDQLNDPKSLQADDEDSELEYLKELRNLRDKDPKLFERIKDLPKKSRSARILEPTHDKVNTGLLTFFRRGGLKKFFFCDKAKSSSLELTFIEAARLFKCSPNHPRHNIPSDYFRLLGYNKKCFNDPNIDDNTERSGGGITSNEKTVFGTIKRFLKKDPSMFEAVESTLSEEYKSYLSAVIVALKKGIIPQQTLKTIKQALDKEHPSDHKALIELLRKNIKPTYIADGTSDEHKDTRREIILSEYLLKE